MKLLSKCHEAAPILKMLDDGIEYTGGILVCSVCREPFTEILDDKKDLTNPELDRIKLAWELCLNLILKGQIDRNDLHRHMKSILQNVDEFLSYATKPNH